MVSIENVASFAVLNERNWGQESFLRGIISTAELIPPEEWVPRNGVPTKRLENRSLVYLRKGSKSLFTTLCSLVCKSRRTQRRCKCLLIQMQKPMPSNILCESVKIEITLDWLGNLIPEVRLSTGTTQLWKESKSEDYCQKPVQCLSIENIKKILLVYSPVRLQSIFKSVNISTYAK